MINAVSKEDFYKIFDRGYKVIPVGESDKGQGKRPLIKEWQQISWIDHDPYDLVDEWFKNVGHLITGMGVLMGADSDGLACIDIDTDDEEIIGRICKYFPSPVTKFGAKGLTLFYKADNKQSRASYRFKVPSGGIIEVFYGGRHIVIPPSWHSGDSFYEWRGIKELADIDIDDLPVLVASHVENIGGLIGASSAKAANASLPKSGQFKDGMNRTLKIGNIIGGIYKEDPNASVDATVARLLDFDAKNFPSNSFFLDPRKSHNKSDSRYVNAITFVSNIQRTIHSRTGQFSESMYIDAMGEEKAIRFNQLNPVTERIENMYEGMPIFDLEMVPEIWRQMIVETCHAQGVPHQAVFMAMFTALGAALQGNTIIQPFKDEKFFRRTNLGCAMVAYSGSKKSDIVKAATRELRLIDKELKHANSKQDIEKVKDIESKIETLDRQKKKLLDDEEIAEINKKIFALQDELDNNKLKGTKFIYEDAPIQKMILDAKNNQEHGLFVVKDEMKQIFADFKKKGNEDARAFYMKGLDGNNSHTYSTISRGEDHIENLYISLITNVQPDVLNAYIKSLYSAYGENDGFIQRFILVPFGEPVAVKPTRLDYNKFNEEYKIFRKAFYSPQVVASIAVECEETYNQMRFEIRTRSNKFFHLPVSGFLNKHEGMLSVFAYIYQYLENPEDKSDVIGYNSLVQAMKLLTYLGKCATFLFNIKDHGQAQDLLIGVAEAITKRAIPDGLTVYEAFRLCGRTGSANTAQFTDALRELEIRGYVNLEKLTNNSMKVNINPEVYIL